jgi:hypothetical protein
MEKATNMNQKVASAAKKSNGSTLPRIRQDQLTYSKEAPKDKVEDEKA